MQEQPLIEMIMKTVVPIFPFYPGFRVPAMPRSFAASVKPLGSSA
jgi:hypothetical protein